jgi:hypothetical protein
MKRYLVQLRSKTEDQGEEIDTRKQAMSKVGHYLASTTETCVIVIIRMKKEVKSGSKNKRRANRQHHG